MFALCAVRDACIHDMRVCRSSQPMHTRLQTFVKIYEHVCPCMTFKLKCLVVQLVACLSTD